MKTAAKFLLVCATAATLSFQSAMAAPTPPGFADLVEKLTPSVVNISTTQKMKNAMPNGMMFDVPGGGEMPPEFREFFKHFGNPDRGQGQQEREVYSLGSGFIIDETGYVATNNHVVADAEEVTVILSDDTKLKAKIIGRDPKTDLALLKVEAGHKLPAAPLGDSDKARVGDWVIAIGNPFGLGGSVTAGIISARARNLNAGPFDDFIQTDAAINRGNSGGPLFNMNGEVIGINTAIFSPSGEGGNVGIGFALPSALAKSVFAQLKTSGHINRGWLGVKIQNVTDEIAESLKLKKTYGALVNEVSKGSPSDLAGIKATDVITEFDGKEIKAAHNLPRLVAETPIGKSVEVQLWRNGAMKTVSLKIGEMKEAKGDADAGEDGAGDEPSKAETAKEVLGLALAPLSDEVREKYDFPADMKGALITRMKPDSAARRSGILPGDIILQAGESIVAVPKDVVNAVSAVRKAGGKYVLLRVLRGKETALFVTVPVAEKK